MGERTVTSGAPSALILTRGNRLTGLLREVEEALREEDSSLALWRAEASLRSLRDLARSLKFTVEVETRELSRAQNARRSNPVRRWRLP